MATTLIPRKFRQATTENDAEPGWLKRQVTGVLQSISRRACLHPIHTIVVVALLASTTYVGLIEGSIFDNKNPRDVAGQVDVDTLLRGSRHLRLGESTAWKWQVEDSLPIDEVSFSSTERILVEARMPNSRTGSDGPAPRSGDVHFPRFYLEISVDSPYRRRGSYSFQCLCPSRPSYSELVFAVFA
jgi:hydroxymethylglutaryl-CoA reductase (NADPH)